MKSLLLILVLVINSSPQNFVRELNSIPITINNNQLKNIFSGGFNNIEVQFVDIDSDGDKDLFFYNSDITSGWFKNIGNAQNPIFEFSLDTISSYKLKSWFYFADIDNDQDFDLFTEGENNLIRFYENIGSKFNPNFVIKYDTLKDNNNDPIWVESNANPIFADTDADGDYDFVFGNSVGSLTYFQNIGNSNNFNFKFISNSWLGILIISGGKDKLHGANALDFSDLDFDNDLDMLWGDFFSRSLFYLKNIGTPSSPNYEVLYSRFPFNEDSLLTSGFNMPRCVDIDNDGDLDMFVSVLYDPTDLNSLIFYKNFGNKFNSDFRKVTNDYIQTLDLGSQSVPTFVDIDNDNDLDLFVGCGQNPNGKLFYFKNNGTAKNASYQLIDSTFFGIQNELSIAPAFGDLDGDNDQDLLIGNFNGTISYFKNIGSSASPNFQFQSVLKDSLNSIIDIGLYARPILIDYDKDNDLDLLIGAFNGKVYCYKNVGYNFSFLFQKNDNYFGSIDVGDNSSLFLIDYDKDGLFDLFIGNRFGEISFYKNIWTNSNPTWQLISNKFMNKTFGGDAVPCFVDIDNDTDSDLFIGNIKGGLYFFRNPIFSSLKEKDFIIQQGFEIVNAYPNPFNPEINFNITLNENGILNISIFNCLGEKVRTVFNNLIERGNKNFTWNGLSDNSISLPSGNYFVLIKLNNNFKSLKVTFLK